MRKGKRKENVYVAAKNQKWVSATFRMHIRYSFRHSHEGKIKDFD
jgi:hypothetical protein